MTEIKKLQDFQPRNDLPTHLHQHISNYDNLMMVHFEQNKL